MKILGIETSCDETAVAILEIKNGSFNILENRVSSSVKIQAKYGGIIPEIAARKQMEYIMPMMKSSLGINEIDYIAVTVGPGLITSLRVGVEVAKTFAYSLNKQIVFVNHMEGHIYSPLFNSSAKLYNIRYPALALLVSGGHTQLILMQKKLGYRIIGETADDAVGEAFDKVARILNLGYPGGPIISKYAIKGDRNRFNLPRPMINSGDFNFSFSGLKTAVLYLVRDNQKLIQNKKNIEDICAAFETACADILVNKTIKAIDKYRVKTVLSGGGVSANNYLRKCLADKIKDKFSGINLFLPKYDLTGDNALMIALAGYFKIKAGIINDWRNVKIDANLKL